METVTVAKDDLLKKLKENRELHSSNYNEALEGYKVKILEKVEKFYSEAKEKIEKGELIIFHQLSRPVSYLKDYDTAISMLEFSIDDKIELTQEEFKNYVQDEWNWKQTFTALNSTYSNK